jgi:diguanylate cyclase (GGDEF)-like protein
MKRSALKSLSMSKYDALLPRLFPDAVEFEIRDERNRLFWRHGNVAQGESSSGCNDERSTSWSDFGFGIGRRQIVDGQLQYRAALSSRPSGAVGWLIVSYDVTASVPMLTAAEVLQRAFADATTFLQEELELQSECNELAIELTERYEELNLVYTTKDQVEYFEEGQEALVRLVDNCVDYLDVGLAALICRDRGLALHQTNNSGLPIDTGALLELLGTTVYDRVESQLSNVVVNEADDEERQRLLAGHSENVLALPIMDNHGTAIGLLAVVSRRDTHTFSNGDRNLLEVMAKKASRIIHTHHDSLTGLMSRSGFESSLLSALASSRSKNFRHCLLHIDIDKLHVVNDLMGHQEGDKLIRRVARLLSSMLRDSDILARLSGDEFGVLLSNCTIEKGLLIADKISAAIRELTVVAGSRQLDVTASIGVSLMHLETEGIVSIMMSAEVACGAAKEEGLGRTQVFANDNVTLVRRSEEVEWIGRIQQALREDQFVLFCQPVMPLAKEKDAPHFEILIRMLEGDQILEPGRFLPAAERFQLMPLVDRWVVSRSLQALRNSWDIIAGSGAVFCINLSGQSLTNTGFLAFVTDELSQSRVNPQQICFEITETAAISNFDEALAFMRTLQDIGCRFALDDFGAGLSSFAYLKMLPVNYLKIDGSLIREVTSDMVSLSMVTAICQIGQTMGLSLIAEFVGDDETIELLRTTGIHYVQGFHVGKPVPLVDITNQLRGEALVVSA